MHRSKHIGVSQGISGLAACVLAAGVWLSATPAHAVPAFAREYGTSCQTCHTVYPRLTPFGEAFRRNGFRFPGKTTDFLRQEPVPLGQDAYKELFPNAVWPAIIPGGAPFAVAVEGGAKIHPDRNSGGGRADNRTVFTLQDLTEEAGLFAAGPIGDQITYFIEVGISSEEGAEFEHGQLQFGDLFGPKHAVNLWLGRFMPTLTNMGPHGSYVADMRWLSPSLTELYGAEEDGAWSMMAASNGVEVNGVLAGWINYAVGLNAGSNIDVRNSQNVYAMVGGKIGGMRLDGEPGGAKVDPKHPWAENAITFDVFAEHSSSHFFNEDATTPDQTLTDHAWAFGGDIRAQWRSLTLDAGARQERHDHALADGSSANMIVHWDELSYIALPWLVPVVRFEYVRLSPDGGPTVSDYRIIPGIAALVRPNFKVTLAANFEGAMGAPDAGWMPAMGMAMPDTPTSTVGIENESVALNLGFAF